MVGRLGPTHGHQHRGQVAAYGLGFRALGARRVDIKTDARNAKARRAIAALGASCEGVLRQWQPSQAAGEDDLLRDTAMYSVVRGEWPEVRQGLEARLASLA